MKFGNTLHQRSIPQWSNYNVDYDDLKQLIKCRTSRHSVTNPVMIPGQGNTEVAWQTLESELLPVLCQQHERVNLFTRSKHGEFQRRLEHVDRQIRLLIRQKNDSAPHPMQYMRRYEKLARESDSVSEDIQSLSRYIAIQKQAFRKIVKKYRKWTGSSGLEHHLNNKIFIQPASMLHLDFSPLLDRLEEVKANLAAFSRPQCVGRDQAKVHARQSSEASPHGRSSSASRLHDVFIHSSSLEFDAVFSTLPLGMAGGRASYWVHKDNLEEVTVLMRRYMKSRKGSLSSPASRTTSITSLSSAYQDGTQNTTPKDRTHISMFDNEQRFVKTHSANTIGQTEALVGSISSLLAMSIFSAKQPEAIVTISDLSPSTPPCHRHIDVARVGSKSLVKLFDPEARCTRPSSQDEDRRSSSSGKNLRMCRDWLAKHRDVKPLAEVQCTRSRFAGLNNTSEVGTWALMDQDIAMSALDPSAIGGCSHGGIDSVQHFPHSIVEVRWEFSRTPEVVRALDSTHLAERVRGFSLEAQTISTVCKPPDMPPLMWQPLLDRDIRKVPPIQTRVNLRRGAPTGTSSGRSSSDNPAASVFSTTATQSSATSPPGSDHHMSPNTPLMSKQKSDGGWKTPGSQSAKANFRPKRPAVQRYWNEFDDGDEFRDGECYAIYVNPDEEFSVPGAEAMAQAFSTLCQGLGHIKRRIVSWFPLLSHGGRCDQDVEEGIYRPLLRHRDLEQDNDDSSDSDLSNPRAVRSKKKATPTRYDASGHRSVTPSWPHQTQHRRPSRRSKEVVLFRTYVVCFAMAALLLVVSSTMRATGRYQQDAEVEAGVVVAVMAAFGSAMIGISLMMSREETLSWLHRSLGAGGFLLVFIWGAWLIALAGGTA